MREQRWVRKWQRDAATDGFSPLPTRVVSNEEYLPLPQTPQSPMLCGHVLGMLIQSLGADHVLWGTDSIWWGSPQWQIEAFRRFTMPEPLMARLGYRPLTPEVKAQILGLQRRAALPDRSGRAPSSGAARLHLEAQGGVPRRGGPPEPHPVRLGAGTLTG